jgi:uncharacterized protein YraI
MATSSARVRSGPGTDFSAVDRMLAGRRVPVLGRNADNSWLYVDCFGTQGWVASSLFVINGDVNTAPVVDQNGSGGTPPSQPTPSQSPPLQPTPPTAAPTGVMATAIITARVRSGPGTAYPLVARVMTGETVPVLGRNADSTWLYVDAGGVKGWTATRLFDIIGDLNALPVMLSQGSD